jgi:thiamine-phosphate pyrophosphorylase
LFPNLSGLYAITDPHLMPGKALFTGVRAALSGGANIIQYRNKLSSRTQQRDEATELLRMTSDFGALLLINDDLALCLDINADGVHLGRSDGDISAARRALGPTKVLGVTCHSDLHYAKDCRILGANYCAFGRVFPSKTKPNAPSCSLTTLKEAAIANYPSVAIGGIDTNNAQQVIACGVDMIAVIHGLFGQTDIRQAATQISQLFTQE